MIFTIGDFFSYPEGEIEPPVLVKCTFIVSSVSEKGLNLEHTAGSMQQSAIPFWQETLFLSDCKQI